MKTLTNYQLKQISAAMGCKEALIIDYTTFEDVDLLQFCTKEQMTLFVTSMFDLCYERGTFDLGDDEMLALINHLSI